VVLVAVLADAHDRALGALLRIVVAHQGLGRGGFEVLRLDLLAVLLVLRALRLAQLAQLLDLLGRVVLLVDRVDRLGAAHELVDEGPVLVVRDEEVVLGLVELPLGRVLELGLELEPRALAQRQRRRIGRPDLGRVLGLEAPHGLGHLLEAALVLGPLLGIGRPVEDQRHLDVGLELVHRRVDAERLVGVLVVEVLDLAGRDLVDLDVLGLAVDLEARSGLARSDPGLEVLDRAREQDLVLVALGLGVLAAVELEQPAVQEERLAGLAQLHVLHRGRVELEDQVLLVGAGRDRLPVAGRLELDAQALELRELARLGLLRARRGREQGRRTQSAIQTRCRRTMEISRGWGASALAPHPEASSEHGRIQRRKSRRLLVNRGSLRIECAPTLPHRAPYAAAL
jgi:hypothetical protein